MSRAFAAAALYARCARRQHLLWLGAGAALVLLLLAGASRELVVGDSQRALADAGLLVLWVLNIVIAVGLTLLFVARERAGGRRLLAVQPISAGHLVWGKFLAVALVLSSLTLGLGLLLAGLHASAGGTHSGRLLIAAGFQTGEALLVSSSLLVLGHLCAPLPAFLGTALLFGIGHMSTDARPLLEGSGSALWRSVVDIAYNALPNYDHLAVTEAAVRGGFSGIGLGWRAMYFAGYSIFLLALSSQIARRSDR